MYYVNNLDIEKCEKATLVDIWNASKNMFIDRELCEDKRDDIEAAAFTADAFFAVMAMAGDKPAYNYRLSNDDAAGLIKPVRMTYSRKTLRDFARAEKKFGSHYWE